MGGGSLGKEEAGVISLDELFCKRIKVFWDFFVKVFVACDRNLGERWVWVELKEIFWWFFEEIYLFGNDFVL